MAENPVDNVGKKNLLALPYDLNSFRPAVLYVAIVSPTTKEVIGYLPASCVDQGDGTAKLAVQT